MKEYARRAEALFRRLAHLDQTFAQWFEQAKSRDIAHQRGFEPDLMTLSELFNMKKYQQGAGDVAFASWNGTSEGNSVASISCDSRSPRVVDRCTLTLPSNGAVAERLLSSLTLLQIVSAMALAWEPEWGIATSISHRDSTLEFADPGTFVGWVMYFARHKGAVPPLPAPVHLDDGKTRESRCLAPGNMIFP